MFVQYGWQIADNLRVFKLSIHLGDGGGGDFQGLYYDRGCMYTLGAESGNTNNNITERNTIYQRSAQFGQYV